MPRFRSVVGLARFKPFTFDLNGNGPKKVHLGKQSNTGPDSRPKPISASLGTDLF